MLVWAPLFSSLDWPWSPERKVHGRAYRSDTRVDPTAKLQSQLIETEGVLFFSRRLIQPEILDHLPPDEARPNLADLVRINRYFGGHSTVRKAVERAAAGSQSFSLLDIGCASGDGARVLLNRYPRAKITCLDYNAVNMECAPHPKLVADAFELPFGPESFDFVFSSLFLHHFSDEQVIRLLGQFYGVARRAVLVCDLDRHVLPYVFLPATRFMFGWNRVTVHDGIRSVRASFRAMELAELGKRAGIGKAGIEVQTYRPAFRISLIARK